MDIIRKFLKFLSRHPVMSIVSVLVGISILIMVQRINARSQGTLTDPIQRGNIMESVYGIGTVTAIRSFQLKPGVISTIQNLFVREGDHVRKGQPLADIDHILYRAPFSGTVVYLPVKVGENVFPQFPVLVLVDLQDRYLVVSMEQQGALRVRAGQRVKMSFDTIRQQSYDGVVQSVYSYGSNFLARIDIASLPPQILPGMTADVAIEIQERDNVLLTPVAAVERGHTVWVKRGKSIPKQIDIKLGVVDKALAEVVAGDLQAGDRLVIRGKKP